MPVALVTLSHIAADNTTKQYFPETHIMQYTVTMSLAQSNPG